MAEESKRDRMLEKVRGLMAKAQGTDNEHEKDAFLAAADRLMQAWAISEFEVAELQQGQMSIPVVSKRFGLSTIDMAHLADPLANLAGTISSHCRTRIVFHGLKQAKWVNTQITVVGLKTDVEWFEMLLTTLLLHLFKNIDPRPVDGEPAIEYIIRAKAAGLKWETIAMRLGIISSSAEMDPVRVGRPMYNEYKRACKERGIEQVKTSPQNWQYNFADAYAGRIWVRLWEMRELNKDVTVGHELVLVSMKEAVDEKYAEMFPKLGTHKEAHHKRNPAASLAGRTAANSADIGNTRLGGSKEQLTG